MSSSVSRLLRWLFLKGPLAGLFQLVAMLLYGALLTTAYGGVGVLIYVVSTVVIMVRLRLRSGTVSTAKPERIGDTGEETIKSY